MPATRSAAPPDSPIANALAEDRLGTGQVAGSMVSAVAPLVVIGGVIPVMIAVTGQIAIAVAVIAVGAVLLIWSRGYLAMARQIDNAGARFEAP